MHKVTLGILVLVFSFNIVSAQGSVQNVNRSSAQVQSRENAELRTINEGRATEMRESIQVRAQENREVERPGIDGREMTQELREAAKRVSEEGADGVIDRALMLRENFSDRLNTDSENLRESMAERNRRMPEIVAERQAELLERRAEMLQNAEERRARLSEERRTRVNSLIEDVLTRLMSTTEKLEGVSARIDSRISSMLEDGLEVGNAPALLEESVILIGNIATEIEIVRAELNDALQDEISATYVRELITEIRNIILDAQQSLRMVLVELNN